MVPALSSKPFTAFVSVPTLSSLDEGLYTVGWSKPFLPQVDFGHGVITTIKTLTKTTRYAIKIKSWGPMSLTPKNKAPKRRACYLRPLPCTLRSRELLFCTVYKEVMWTSATFCWSRTWLEAEHTLQSESTWYTLTWDDCLISQNNIQMSRVRMNRSHHTRTAKKIKNKTTELNWKQTAKCSRIYL